MFEENGKQLQSEPHSQSPKNLTSATAIKQFMLRVVPWPTDGEPGYVNLHWHLPGARFQGRAFRNVDEFCKNANALAQSKQSNLYFCLSRQAIADKRKTEDAQAFKAAWLDLDVKEKGYATIEEAIDALFEFIEHYHLPPPSAVVVSGNGLHVYWFSTRPLSFAEWRPYAEGLKAAALQWGLKCDAGLTANAACVLRVPGTRNFKTDPPKRVYLILLRDEDIDFAANLKPLLDLAPAPRTNGIPEGLIIADAFKHLDPNKNVAEGIVIDELPPLPLEPILAGCAWLKEAFETGGKDFDEPQWNLTTLVSLSLENGHELAHKFGSQHEGYTFESTEKKLEEKQRARETKNVGWPSCEKIQDAGSKHCKTCPHLDKGKSPLNLALQQPAEPLPPNLVLTLADWEARDLPAPDHILGDLLSTTTRLLLAADTGIGKTLFSLAIGMRCALGCGFLHWTGIRPARVLYIDGEMSNRQFKQRLAQETERMRARPETFFALSREDIPGMQPLNTHAGQMTIEAVIREHCDDSIDLILFDNIMALVSGNHSEEEGWAKTMPWILSLTQRAIGQMWVHHTGHDTSRQYGTKTREWQMDAYAQFEKVSREDTDVSFLLSFHKARERTPNNRRDFADTKVALVNNGWIHEDASSGKKLKLSPEGQKYLEALRELTGILKPNEFYKLVPLERWQHACVKRGLIEAKGPSHRSLFSKYKRDLLAKNWIACNETDAWILP